MDCFTINEQPEQVHTQRRKDIIKRYPQVKVLFGPYPLSALLSHTRRCLRACSKPDTAAYVGQLGLGALNFAIGSDDYLSEKVREYRLSIVQAKPNGRVPNNSFSCTPVTLVLNNDRKACPVFCGHGDNPLPKRHAPDRPT